MPTTPQATLDDLGWWQNFPVSTVGPASPLQRSQPGWTDEDTGADDERQELASVTTLPAHTADHDTVPISRHVNPPRDDNELKGQTSAVSAGEGPARQPNSTNSTSTIEVSPDQHPTQKASCDEIREPDPPNYWGARLLSVVYWIAIVTGAGGQTFGFGAIFDIGAVGYAGAAVIATTAETIMIAAGDTALKLRAQGAPARQWVPFMLIAFGAATAAAGMNVVHFAGIRVEMAVLFGLISFLGFVLHFVEGFIHSTNYRHNKRQYDQQLADRRAREQAEAERQHQQEKAQRQQEETQRRQVERIRSTAATAPTSNRSSRKQRARQDIAVSIGLNVGATTPTQLSKALDEAGYLPGSEGSLKNWCRQIKKAQELPA